MGNPGDPLRLERKTIELEEEEKQIKGKRG